jgi:hypothetical protein
MKQTDYDRHRSHRVLVRLLKGPIVPRGFNTPEMHALYHLKTMELVRSEKTGGRAYRYSLTPKGIQEATKWDYKLKALNQHPDQVPKVTKIAASETQTPETATETAELAAEVEQEQGPLFSWSKTKETQEIDRLNGIIENLREDLRQWQQHYIRLAEKQATRNQFQ